MRFIARSTLVAYAETQPECKLSLAHSETIMRRAQCKTMHDVLRIYPKAKIINGERARFEIAGGNHHMICAIDFDRSVVFVKFVGTHAEHDRIDGLTVAIY